MPPRAHLETVKLLLEHGADPNLAEEGVAPYGHALYAAAAAGHFELAALLLEKGAHPCGAVESSADCLTRAIMNEDQRMIELLSSYGAARSVEILGYCGDVQTAAAVFRANPALADDPVGLGGEVRPGRHGGVVAESRSETQRRRRPALGHAPRVGEAPGPCQGCGVA
jgi:hypothetical protein